MKKNGKLTGTLCILTALTVLFSACGSSSSPAATTSSSAAATSSSTAASSTTAAPAAAANSAPELKDFTIVGIRDAQLGAQQILADKMGYYKEEGLNVTNQLIESGPDIIPMVAGGSAPISIGTNFFDIIMASNNVSVKVVAPLAEIAGTQAVVGSKNLVLKSAKDLEGKTIGMPSGAETKYAIDQMGKELGVDVSKIKFINLAPSDALTALQKGDIDAMASHEPFVTKAINSGGKLLFSGTKSFLPEKTGDVNWMQLHTTLQVTDDFLKKNPNTIKAVLRALKKANDYLNSNRDAAIKILAPEFHLDEAELKQIMERNIYSLTVDDSYLTGSNGTGILNYFLSVGNIKSIPKVSSYNDFSLLKAVDPTLIKSELK
jgi:ABC-type nitrate/sulfonate/bicarbonate transport system substrate-binding protein